MPIELSPDVVSALKEASFVTKRNMLRIIVYKELCLYRDEIKAVFASSPIVGSGTGKVDVAPTPSGLRDALPKDLLVALAVKAVSVTQILEAIQNPAEKGVGGATTTGYRFGYPKGIDVHGIAKDVVLRVKSIAFSTPPTTGAHTMTEEVTTVSMSDVESKYDALPPMTKKVVDATLGSADLPGYGDMIAIIHKAGKLLSEAKTYSEEKEKELESLRKRAAMAVHLKPMPIPAPAKAGIPSGNVELIAAWEALDMPALKKQLDFDCPKFTWDDVHPHVPEIDEHYVHRPNVLIPVLHGLIGNMRPWVYGDTGCGKSTAIQQVCARLGWPYIPINLDSEITRLDLIGRDVLKNDGASTISEFVDGLLPQWLCQTAVIAMEEIDFARPDVIYVMQRVLEGKGLTVTEDGGRVVHPGHWNRICATANTTGTGDTGRYPGSRVQSSAFLNRWNLWIKVEYMSEKDEIKLLDKRVPGIPAEVKDSIERYIVEHRQAFKDMQVLQPLSPRNIQALGETFSFLSNGTNPLTVLRRALDWTVIFSASPQDAQILAGIANRCIRS